MVSMGQEPQVHIMPHRDALAVDIHFWKQIFGRLSLNQYRVHDSEYLAIHYKTVTFDTTLSDKQREDALDGIKEQIDDLLVKLHKNEYAPGSLNRWEQTILDQFEVVDEPNKFQKARKRIRAQQGIKENFLAGVKRSGAYLAHIRQVFSDKGLPDFLVYLPHIESSFNPKAVSHVGAGGMWQFMPRTARDFMKVNKVIDDRFDPYKATYGAAKLLKWNYRKLNDWALAITAYNHGLGSMLKAKRRYGDYLTIREKYLRRSFGFASKNFYPELLAVVEMIDSSKYYFPDIEPSDSAWVYQEIKLPAPIKLKDLARDHSLDMEELRSLNPAYRRRAWAGDVVVPAGYTLRLPMEIESEPILAAITPGTQSAVAATVVDHRGSGTSGSSAWASTSNVHRENLQKLLSSVRIGVVVEDDGLPVPALGATSWIENSTAYSSLDLLLDDTEADRPDLARTVPLPKAQVDPSSEARSSVLTIAVDAEELSIDDDLSLPVAPIAATSTAQASDLAETDIQFALIEGDAAQINYQQFRPFPENNANRSESTPDQELSWILPANVAVENAPASVNWPVSDLAVYMPLPSLHSFAGLEIPVSEPAQAIELTEAENSAVAINLQKPTPANSVGSVDIPLASADVEALPAYEIWANAEGRTAVNGILPQISHLHTLTVTADNGNPQALNNPEETALASVVMVGTIAPDKPAVNSNLPGTQTTLSATDFYWMNVLVENEFDGTGLAFADPPIQGDDIQLAVEKNQVMAETGAYLPGAGQQSMAVLVDSGENPLLAAGTNTPSAIVADSLLILNGGPLSHVASRNVRLTPEQIRRHLAQRLQITGDVVTIFPGETIGHLSEWLQTAPRLLRQRNQIGARQKLLTGQKLSVSFANVSPEVFLERRVSYHMQIMSELLQHSAGIELVQHTVRSGENFWNLSRKRYKFPVNLLLYFNDLDKLDKLYPGDIIMLPVTFN